MHLISKRAQRQIRCNVPQMAHQRRIGVRSTDDEAVITGPNRAHERRGEIADQGPREGHGEQVPHPLFAVPTRAGLQHQYRLKHEEPQRIDEIDQIGDPGVADEGLQEAPGIDAKMQRAVPLIQQRIEIERLDQRHYRLQVREGARGDGPEREYWQRQEQPVAVQEVISDPLPGHGLEVRHLADARVIEIPERERAEERKARRREESQVGLPKFVVGTGVNRIFPRDYKRGEAEQEREQDQRAVFAQ